jgi:hypothetical protein
MSQCEELMRPWECYAKHRKRFSSSCHLLLVTWPWFVIFSMFQSCRWIRVCLATWASRCLTLWLYILTCAKDWFTACYEGMPFPLAWEPKPWGGNKRKWYEDGSKFKAFASKDGHHVSYFSISSMGTQCLAMFEHVWPCLTNFYIWFHYVPWRWNNLSMATLRQTDVAMENMF